MNVELYNEGNDFGKKLTKVEIINETVAFYSADTTRRSKNKDGFCVYAGPDGRKCAYSRCWKEGVYNTEYEDKGPNNADIPEPDNLLQEKYKGHSAQFWLSIQRLHDNDKNWNPNGLTEEGKLSVERLLETHKD